MKTHLRDVFIAAAQDVDVKNRSALVIHFPFKVWATVKKIQYSLIRDLEKKFKKDVILTANRQMLDKDFRRRGIKIRPRGKTLTAVHAAISLELLLQVSDQG